MCVCVCVCVCAAGSDSHLCKAVLGFYMCTSSELHTSFIHTIAHAI